VASHSAILSIKILTDARDAAKGMEQASSGVDKWKGRLNTAAKGAGIVLAGLGAAAISFGKAAADDAQGAAVLAKSLQNSTGATKDQVSAVEDWITKTTLATGVADDDLRPALGTLARATGSVAKSQKAMNLALDIAAATGKDVGSVSEALAKGYAGNTAGLARLVPGLSKAVLATGDMNKISKELARTTGGSAAAAADTAAGKYARMQVAIQETKESLGTALLPIMSKVSSILGEMAVVIGKNTGAFTIIAGVIAAVAAAIVVLNFALKAYNTILEVVRIAQASTWAAALGPIALVIAAIVLIVAAIVILYKKSATFRNFVDAMWRGIKDGALAVVAAIRPAFNALFAALKVYVQVWWAYLKLVFGLIKGAVQLVVAIFKGDWRGALDAVRGILASFKQFFVSIFNLLPGPVKDALNSIRGFITGAFTGAKSTVATVIGWIKTAISGIKTTAQSVFGGLEAVLTAPFNAARSAVESLIGWVDTLLDKISSIKLPSVGGILGHLPGLNMAPEVPTGPAGRTFAADPTVTGMGARSRTAGGSGPTIIVQGALDPEAVARQIRAILSGHDRRVGLTGRAV
jgi:phage-related protein